MKSKSNQLKITMLGAGSGFVINVARELAASSKLQNSKFVLMDSDAGRLEKARSEVMKIMEQAESAVQVEAVETLREALVDCNYVITSCERDRYPLWIKDVEIPQRHGVHQYTAENGGPGGQMHALRNIAMFQPILDEMARSCPNAWLMNFTNPMSFLCTYFKNYASNPALGFCHQVHGSFGVIAEMLGMEPGELQVVTGGINHFNWLFDVRRRGTSVSFKNEFFDRVKKSEYWQKVFRNMPDQKFTLEILKTFGEYCVGYDDHIVEYLPFFYEHDEWAEHGYESILTRRLIPAVEEGSSAQRLEQMTLMPEARAAQYPFPKDDTHPYYAEKPCEVIEALETNTPLYLDAINIRNNGAISNLPADAIVDVPAVVVGGEVRSICVGELPIGPMELCRRQITLHEMIAKAAHDGDENLVVQSLCLDPYVHSITQARKIWCDFKKEYIGFLPRFQ